MTAYAMKFECKLPNDGSHDQGVSLDFPAKLNLLAEFIDDSKDRGYFQRTKVYKFSDEKIFILIEQVWNDYRILKFNYPFTQKGDTLFFDFS